MITTTAPKSLRKASAIVGVAGLLALAGCSGAADGEVAPDTATDAETPTAETPVDATYADGVYTAEGSYQTPETVEKISVTLTLADGEVTEVEVTGDPQARETEQYQGEFIGGIAEEVVGVDLNELNVSRVAGSSLTSGGFNQAVESIKQQAAE